MMAVIRNFTQMIRNMVKDKMLFAVCFVPIIVGLIFRFAVPAIEAALTTYFHRAQIIAPYYSLLDLFYACIAPTMFNYVVAMTMLEERDDRITQCLYVTPLGRKGYFMSRMGLTSIIAVLLTCVFLPLFGLTRMTFPKIIIMSFSGCVTGLMIAGFINIFSHNKIEGMAVTKLSSLIIVAAIIPYFISGKVKYILSFLPSFWMEEYMRTPKMSNAIILISISILCGFIVIKRSILLK